MTTKKRGIEPYEHTDKTRTNNPDVGLVTPSTDPDEPGKTYDHDPRLHDPQFHDRHFDPSLSWAGKAENTSFEVPTVSLHVHERIEPRTIIEAVRKGNGRAEDQLSFFSRAEENRPLREAIDFYRHQRNWSNRLIAGDSLLVMNSLLEKEGLGGQVQMVYIDPPYGINYGSNFQPFVNQREVDDKDENLTTEPEQIRAFRDTWELGIHSYLSCLRDRLLLARELLHETGSCFVQIGDENVHLLGAVMDEIFGPENRVATITYATTGGSSAKTLPEVADYLLWYAKDKNQVKYRKLYEPRTRSEVIQGFNWDVMVELPNGQVRKPTPEERFDPNRYLPEGARIYRRVTLLSQGGSDTGRSEPYEWRGRIYPSGETRHWRVSPEGLDRLAELGRLDAAGENGSLSWKLYEDEVPGRRIHNVWFQQMSEKNKGYVVQTAEKVIQRCLLMTTDPGDLVFDPTCGGGTTAYVAEQWGRRWITCDTSRVAVFAARARLMTAHFDYYQLAHPDEGVGAGFRYRSVAAVSARTLAYDEPPQKTFLYDQPHVDRKKARVTGPFTVEAVPPPAAPAQATSIDEIRESDEESPPDAPDAAAARSGPTVSQADWRDELVKTGIRCRAGQRLSFTRLEPLPGTRWLHADGETPDPNSGPTRTVVSFGPDHAPLEQRQVARAIEEAHSLGPPPGVIVFAAFQFDPEAAKDIDETLWPGVVLLKAQMSADLLTEDLKKKRAGNESFWLIGQPDVKVEKVAGNGLTIISIQGFDYYNVQKGTVEPGNAEKIAVWMLDPDYDGRSVFPRQVFFPMADPKYDWAALARVLKTRLDADRMAAYRTTTSLPFEPGEHRRAAVKIVDDRGIESLKVIELEEAKHGISQKWRPENTSTS